MERKVLGYYMSKHPMESYLNELNDMNLKNILSINNYIIDNSITKLNTTISGVIIDSRIQKIGKNKYLNIFKVDDGSGFINASFFEEKYLTYKHLIKEDVILFFHGETFIDEYDSQLSMRVDNVYSLNDARERHSKYIEIILTSDLKSKETLQSIKDIITESEAGNTKVTISYVSRDLLVPIRFKKEISIKINDKLMQSLQSIVGTKNVIIKY